MCIYSSTQSGTEKMGVAMMIAQAKSRKEGFTEAEIRGQRDRLLKIDGVLFIGLAISILVVYFFGDSSIGRAIAMLLGVPSLGILIIGLEAWLDYFEDKKHIKKGSK